MKFMKKAAETMAKISLKSAKSVSLSASLFGFHQPKEPKALKSFKSIK